MSILARTARFSRTTCVAVTALLTAMIVPAYADPPNTTAVFGHVGGSIYVHFAAAPPAGTNVGCSWSTYVTDQYTISYTTYTTATVNGQLAVCNFNAAYRFALATPGSSQTSPTLSVSVLLPSGNPSIPFSGGYWSQSQGSMSLPANGSWTVVSQDVYF